MYTYLYLYRSSRQLQCGNTYLNSSALIRNGDTRGGKCMSIEQKNGLEAHTHTPEVRMPAHTSQKLYSYCCALEEGLEVIVHMSTQYRRHEC